MIPVSYARAIYQIAEEEGTEDIILEEFRSVCRIFKENSAFRVLLDSPSVNAEEKERILERVFSGKINDTFLDFLKLISARRLAVSLDECFSQYYNCYDKAHGIEYATVISAKEISDELKEKLSQKLEKLTGKKIALHTKYDKSVIGGLIVKYNDIVYDGSVKTRLSDVEKRLKGVT